MYAPNKTFSLEEAGITARVYTRMNVTVQGLSLPIFNDIVNAVLLNRNLHQQISGSNKDRSSSYANISSKSSTHLSWQPSNKNIQLEHGGAANKSPLRRMFRTSQHYRFPCWRLQRLPKSIVWYPFVDSVKYSAKHCDEPNCPQEVVVLGIAHLRHHRFKYTHACLMLQFGLLWCSPATSKAFVFMPQD